MVCLGCGRSVRKIRHHNVDMDSSILAVILSQHADYRVRTLYAVFFIRCSIYLFQPRTNNCFVCHPCWIQANRLANHDSSRNTAEESSSGNRPTTNVTIFEAVRPPEPPPLPTGLLQRRSYHTREAISITLSNYKRASSTSAHCIFHQCRNMSLHLIPHFRKILLLEEYNYYVPRSCRVCETHLYGDGIYCLNLILFVHLMPTKQKI